MLNAFLPLPANARVVSADIQNPSLYPENFDPDEKSQEKLFIVDLLVRILITMPDGRELEEMATREMQNYIENFFLVRLLIYWARAYSSTVKKGDPYSVAKTVYVLAFTPGVFPQSEGDDYYNLYRITNAKTHALYSSDLNIITVELGKFTKGIDQLLDEKEEISYVFKHKKSMSLERLVPILMEGDIMSVALQSLSSLYSEREFQKAYALKLRLIEKIKKEEEDRNEKLIAEGKAEGRIEGKAEGRVEKEKEIAKELLREGVDLAVILKSTGLSESAITKLSQEL